MVAVVIVVVGVVVTASTNPWISLVPFAAHVAFKGLHILQALPFSVAAALQLRWGPLCFLEMYRYDMRQGSGEIPLVLTLPYMK